MSFLWAGLGWAGKHFQIKALINAHPCSFMHSSFLSLSGHTHAAPMASLVLLLFPLANNGIPHQTRV